MASFTYNEAAEEIQKGTIVYTSDTIKARLLAAAATPNKDDVNLSTGYTAIGTDQTLGNKSLNKNTTDDRVEYLQSTMLTWSSVAAGSTVGWIIIYKFVTDDAGSTPLFAIDLSSDVPTNGGDLTWTPPSNVVGYSQQ